MPFVARTFEGLPGEADWIALREFVPAASAYVRVEGHDRPVGGCSMVPGNGAGIVRSDGEIWLGLQVAHNFGDISRDLAYVVDTAREIEPGNPVPVGDPGIGPRIQDIANPASTFAVEVYDGFVYWIEGSEASDRAEDLLAAAHEPIGPPLR